MGNFVAWLRALLDANEASLTDLRSRERAKGPSGRTVPAGEAVRPESEVSICSCGAKFLPRLGGKSCLSCERGADPALAKLVIRREPSTSPAEATPADAWPPRRKAVRS